MKKLSFMKTKKFVAYVKKKFSTGKNDKKKLEIIVITPENLGDLFIVFAI